MISILIPTYNHNVYGLVKELHSQFTDTESVFEIIVIDDGSNSPLNKENEFINDLPNCKFKALKSNIGRSAMRNLLASDAGYDSLLFIDAGSFPKSKSFIKDYLPHINNDVTIGGATYLETPPKKPFKLRWLYTKEREHNSNLNNNKPVIGAANFLIKKRLFKPYQFDESIKRYGCEDVVFFDQLIKNQITITHINNPIIHDAMDSADEFITKTEIAVENLIDLIEQEKIEKNRYRVSRLYYSLKKVGLDGAISLVFRVSKKLLIKNFNSSQPFIFLYDFYRLGYFCTLKNNY